MIPKIIHYCWFGKGPMPKSQRDCVKGWKKLMPDYQIICWDESNFDFNQFKASKYAYEVKKFALVSDVCRYNVLAEYGGIYLDTDVELFKRFDRFLNCSFFSGIELYREFEQERIAELFLRDDGTPKTKGTDIPHLEILTSTMGCCKGNEMICRIRDYYNTVDVDADSAFHYRDWVNNDRLVARHLTEYGFKYINETQHLDSDMVVYGTGVFGHEFCPDQRYEVSWHYNAASWLDRKGKKSKIKVVFEKMGLGSLYARLKEMLK